MPCAPAQNVVRDVEQKIRLAVREVPFHQMLVLLNSFRGYQGGREIVAAVGQHRWRRVSMGRSCAATAGRALDPGTSPILIEDRLEC